MRFDVWMRNGEPVVFSARRALDLMDQLMRIPDPENIGIIKVLVDRKRQVWTGVGYCISTWHGLFVDCKKISDPDHLDQLSQQLWDRALEVVKDYWRHGQKQEWSALKG